ncbi:MAG: hypothetical protein NXI32_31060 [bacterium]|nr:hypothetical protein [bacterium]
MNDWLNRGYHALSPDDLIATLTRMFERGDIDAYYNDDFNKPATIDTFLKGLGNSECNLHCGVTHAGGKRWEQLANPDWDRYFEGFGWDGDNVLLLATTLERLDELTANAEVLWNCKMTLANNDIIEIVPWEPFTWKTLPRALKATVRYIKCEFVPRSREQIMIEHEKDWPREVELSWTAPGLSSSC